MQGKRIAIPLLEVDALHKSKFTRRFNVGNLMSTFLWKNLFFKEGCPILEFLRFLQFRIEQLLRTIVAIWVPLWSIYATDVVRIILWTGLSSVHTRFFPPKHAVQLIVELRQDGGTYCVPLENQKLAGLCSTFTEENGFELLSLLSLGINSLKN